MSFNDPAYIREFTDLVSKLNIKTALEIGYGSGELVEALRQININAEGIDKSTELSQGKQAPYLHNVALEDFNTGKKYDLVYSSGVLEHFEPSELPGVIEKMASLSINWVLNLVPNAKCTTYKNAKLATAAEWKDEFDYEMEEFMVFHELASLKVFMTGTAGREWAKRFGPEPSDPYLVYCLATVSK